MEGILKHFVALARVSSCEQEQSGFSLTMQEDAPKQYAAKAGGEIIRLFRVAETASKTEERKTFKELLAYVKTHAHELDGFIVYKINCACRNLTDVVELERLEREYDVPMPCVTPHTARVRDLPAGMPPVPKLVHGMQDRFRAEAEGMPSSATDAA